MKKIKTFLTATAILAAITSTTYAAEIPVECAPENATAESIAITENLISPILDEVQDGLGYQPAWCKAHNAVFNAVLLFDLTAYGFSQRSNTLVRTVNYMFSFKYLDSSLANDPWS